MRRMWLALGLILLPLVAFGQGTSPIVPATQKSAAIAISSATTTRLVALNGTQSIYVTAVDVVSDGTGHIQFIAGTGSTCGTGTVNITGNYSLTAQVGFTKGTGVGALWVVPPGLSLCAVTDAAVNMTGSLAYAQF